MWAYFTVYFPGYLLQLEITVSRLSDRVPDYSTKALRLRPPWVPEIDFMMAALLPYVTDISVFLDELF